jgi:hypothetical protein
MGHWTRSRFAYRCRHCSTSVPTGDPIYLGKHPSPFCASCAKRIIGFDVPADLPADPTPAPTERHALPTFARFDRGRFANLQDPRTRQAGKDE